MRVKKHPGGVTQVKIKLISSEHQKKKKLKPFSSLPHKTYQFDTERIAAALRDPQIKHHLGNFKGLFQQYHFLSFPTPHPFFFYALVPDEVSAAPEVSPCVLGYQRALQHQRQS